jgi:hypothetical protein
VLIVDIIEKLIFLKPLIGFLTAAAALGSLVLLAVNALLIYRYVEETRKQAEATYNIMEFNRAEFLPNVQVLFEVEKKEINGVICRGLFCDSEGGIRIPVKYINLSKGVSEFSLNFQDFPTVISTFAGPIRFEISTVNLEQKIGPAILKRAEEFRWYIPFDLKRAFDKSGKDFDDLNILRNSDFSVCYRVEYPGRTEPFSEHWNMVITGLEALGGGGLFLLGTWSTFSRKRYRRDRL